MEFEEFNLEVPNFMGVDITSEDALRKYFENLEVGIHATNSLSAYFHYLKGLNELSFIT